MGIFSRWTSGSSGGGVRRCQTPGCVGVAVAGSAWCQTCLDTPRLAPPPAFSLPAATTPGDGVPASDLDRYQCDCSAPHFADDWRDLRCRWCCQLIAEQSRGQVRPLRANFECLRHRVRREAHLDLCDSVDWMRIDQQMTTAQIEQVFTYGYLGYLIAFAEEANRVPDDEPFD